MRGVSTRESEIARRGLLKEPPPDPEAQALVDALEETDDLGGSSGPDGAFSGAARSADRAGDGGW